MSQFDFQPIQAIVHPPRLRRHRKLISSRQVEGLDIQFDFPIDSVTILKAGYDPRGPQLLLDFTSSLLKPPKFELIIQRTFIGYGPFYVQVGNHPVVVGTDDDEDWKLTVTPTEPLQ